MIKIDWPYFSHSEQRLVFKKDIEVHICSNYTPDDIRRLVKELVEVADLTDSISAEFEQLSEAEKASYGPTHEEYFCKRYT